MLYLVFFFKQKTAYEMRISDWSSDVCSSDLDEAVDAVTLSVVWSALVAITEEMGVALRNTAYSSAVREGDDFSTGLFDSRGRLVAQGNFTPGHLGAMPFVLEHIRSEEHTSELQSLMRISYAVFCLKKKNNNTN